MTIPDGELQELARAEFLARLTDAELAWLSEPGEEALALVVCPAHPNHNCACQEREREALDSRPEFVEEMGRRWAVLCERWEEVLAREPVRAGGGAMGD